MGSDCKPIYLATWFLEKGIGGLMEYRTFQFIWSPFVGHYINGPSREGLTLTFCLLWPKWWKIKSSYRAVLNIRCLKTPESEGTATGDRKPCDKPQQHPSPSVLCCQVSKMANASFSNWPTALQQPGIVVGCSLPFHPLSLSFSVAIRCIYLCVLNETPSFGAWSEHVKSLVKMLLL